MRKITILFILTVFFLLSCSSDSGNDVVSDSNSTEASEKADSGSTGGNEKANSDSFEEKEKPNSDSTKENEKPEADSSSSEKLPENKNITTFEYKPSNDIIYNPDMGFYSAETIAVTSSGKIDTTSIESASFLNEEGSFNSNATFNLIHLKIDISQCKNLTHLDLSGIDTLLSNLEKGGQTTVIRFAYDKNYKGNKSDVEPKDFSTILNHIEDICALLKKHTKVLTALECGMLGPWGEMHTTSFAEDPMPVDKFKSTLKGISPNLNPSIKASEKKIEKGYIVIIMEKFLSCLDGTELPFLVRQPNFIYNYLKRCENLDFDGENVPASYTPNAKTYKLGIYNDGYLGSDGDSGTFRIDRKKEIAFLEPFTNHTPYGGELIGDYTLSVSDEQLKNVHLSFLNIGWNADFLGNLDKKSAGYTKGQSIFRYILNHMGYRYVATNSTIEQTSNSSVKIKLTLKNEGFAELPYHRTKNFKVYFVRQGEEASGKNALSTNASGSFTGGMSSIESDFTLPSGLENGDYQLFLKICDTDGKYAVRLANENMWNESLRANKIGDFKVGK